MSRAHVLGGLIRPVRSYLFLSLLLIAGILYLLIAIPMVVRYARAESIAIAVIDGSERGKPLLIEGRLTAGGINKVSIRTAGIFPPFDYELSTTESVTISDQSGEVSLSTDSLNEPHVQGIDPYEVGDHVVALVESDDCSRIIGIRKAMPTHWDMLFALLLWAVALGSNVSLLGSAYKSILVAHGRGGVAAIAWWCVALVILATILIGIILARPF